MSRMGKISYSKKRKAKRIRVCHKCTMWTCDKHYRSKGIILVNWLDKICLINDGLSKGSLDHIIQSLDTHLSGDIHRILLDLIKLFNK